ncbi:hypothetical protein ACFE04_011922 [Oxalis oulophora]
MNPETSSEHVIAEGRNTNVGWENSVRPSNISEWMAMTWPSMNVMPPSAGDIGTSTASAHKEPTRKKPARKAPTSKASTSKASTSRAPPRKVQAPKAPAAKAPSPITQGTNTQRSSSGQQGHP